MAQDTEQLLTELKEVLNGMKDFGQYAKDITSALNTAAKPMQQFSDYMKAVGEQSRKSEEAVAGMVEDIKELGQHMQTASRLTAEEKQARVDILALRREFQELRNKELEGNVADKDYYRDRTRDGEIINKAMREQLGILDKLKASSREHLEDLIKQGYELDKNGKLAEKEGGAMARLGVRGRAVGSEAMFGLGADPTANVSNILSKLTAFAPAAGMGGIVGMMIYGRMEDAKFNAIGQQTSQMFDSVGGAGDKFASRMGGLARTLSVHGMAAAEDLAAVAGAFRSTGMTAADATTKIEGFSSVGSKELIVATLAMDKHLEVAAGTTAKLAGTLARDFNTSAKEAFINLVNYGTAAKQAGLDTASFMQQSMEAASSLRLLNANAEAVMSTQLQMAKSMKARGFDTQFGGAYAAQGTASVTQGVAGLGEGLSAIIGERLGLGSGMDALYAMKSPLGRQADQKIDMAAIMKEMRGIVQDMSPNRSEQAFALTKLMGVDYSGADTILDVMDEVSSTGSLSAKAQQDLNHAFQSESQKQSQILLDIKKIQDGFARVSSGLLSEIILGLKMLVDAVMGGFFMLRGVLEGGKLGDLYKEKGQAYLDMIGPMANQSEKVMNNVIVPGLKQIAGAGGDLLSQYGINFEGVSSKRVDDINDRIDHARARHDTGDDAMEGYDDTPSTQGGSKVTKKRYIDPTGRTDVSVEVKHRPPHKSGKGYDSTQGH